MEAFQPDLLGQSNCFSGVQNPIQKDASFFRYKTDSFKRGIFKCSSGGGRNFVDQRGSGRGSGSASGRVFFNVFPSSQKDRRPETDPEPQTNKRVYCKNIFQDGDVEHSYSSPTSGGVVSRNGSERRILSRSDTSRSLEVFKVCHTRQILPVQGSSIRSNHISKGVHENSGSCDGVFETARHPSTSISGRHFDCSRVKDSVAFACPGGSKCSDGCRLHDKSKKVSSDPFTGLSIFGGKVSTKFKPCVSSIRKSLSSDKVCLNFQSRQLPVGQELASVTGSDGINHLHGKHGSFVYKANTNLFQQPVEVQNFPIKSQSVGIKQSVSGHGLVEKHQQFNIRFAPVPSSSVGCHHDRCILKRMGRCVVGGGRGAAQSVNSRCLVLPTGSPTYKRSRVSGCARDSIQVSSPLDEQNSDGQVGQYDSMLIHSQDRGDKVPTSLSVDHSTLGVVQKQQHSATFSTSPRGGQSTSRCFVTPFSAKQGMGFTLPDNQLSVHHVGSSCNRSVCNSKQQKITKLLFNVPLSLCSGPGCFFNSLGKVSPGVSFSTNCDFTQSNQKSISGQGQSNFNCTTVATEELVYSNNEHVSGNTTAATSVAGVVATRQVSPSRPRRVQSSCLENQRGFLRKQGFSEKVVGTMLQARKPSTQACYNAKWSKFSGWCGERGVNPSLASVPVICEFLQFMFDEGYKYTTITGYVSAISHGHIRFSKESLGLVKEISQFLKGVFRLRPPLKDTVPVWDLSVVLEALLQSPFEPAESASLQAWTWKTVFLVAVTSAARVSEIQALDSRRELLKLTSNRVTMKANPAFLPKVPKVEFINRTIELEAFNPSVLGVPEKFASICPVRAVKIYLQKTAKSRKDHNLFLSYSPSHLGFKVSSATISRWIRDTICHAYRHANLPIPRSRLKAHSTRAMAATLADISGVTSKELCDVAMWSNPNVFARFYRLDVASKKSISSQVLSAAFDV